LAFWVIIFSNVFDVFETCEGEETCEEPCGRTCEEPCEEPHQEVSDRRLMHQSTPCVDQRQKAMKYEPFVNQRRLKTCSTTHFRCKTTHSKMTVLKNAYNSIY